MEAQTKRGYCFTAIVGQNDMKTALILNAVNPNLSGVLIRGEKGTAKSTAVRALAELLPLQKRVVGCKFGCDPDDKAHLCSECQDKSDLESYEAAMQVVDLPVSATEDRVVGTLDIEYAIKTGEKKFEAGILARANRNILYVDEVNLLDDHVVDVLLDSAAMGVNTVEREGVSYSHPAQFILVGTMNPEEGDLRPQLIDRFGLSVTIEGERNPDARVQVMENRLLYENEPERFFAEYEPKQVELRERIIRAQKLLPEVQYRKDILRHIAQICIELDVDGHRADIGMLKTAITLAAYDNRSDVQIEDVKQAARFVLPHRMRRRPFEETEFDISVVDRIYT
jgi:magnesium chelatase subunit I